MKSDSHPLDPYSVAEFRRPGEELGLLHQSRLGVVMAVLSLFFALLPYPAGAQDASDGPIPENLEVSVEKNPADQMIVKRLEGVFAALPGLEGVMVSASSGVVTLEGEVASAQALEEALEITRRTNGVIYVRDRLESSTALDKRLSPAAEKATSLARTLIRNLPLILLALVVLILSVAAGGFLQRRQSWFMKLGLPELPAALAARLARLALIAAGLLVALEILDATAVVGAILGVAGVAGIALGFAFRNIVENYLAGVLLSLRNPFSSGDSVEIEGHQGKVVSLTSRDTILLTLDGNHVRIPNSLIMTSVLTNFSRNPLRRLQFEVGVSVELGLGEVRSLALEVLGEIGAILQDPPPGVVIEKLGDSTVVLKMFAWIDQQESDITKTRSEAIRLMKERFDAEGIEMPEPIYRLLMKEVGSGTKALNRGEEKETFSRTKKKANCSSAVDTAKDAAFDRHVAQVEASEAEPNLLVAADD